MSKMAITWIGLVFGAVSFIGMLGAVWVEINDDANAIQTTLEQVQEIAVNGPTIVVLELEEIRKQLNDIEERQIEMQIEMARGCESE